MQFQHTAARRRLAIYQHLFNRECAVSTHSRPKAAGTTDDVVVVGVKVSTHSRPKAAGSPCSTGQPTRRVSTHSRPKAAGRKWIPNQRGRVSTHSRPKAAGTARNGGINYCEVSTHSRPKAAGEGTREMIRAQVVVSTHSRPKAAEQCCKLAQWWKRCFNTQPPEGGWTRSA